MHMFVRQDMFVRQGPPVLFLFYINEVLVSLIIKQYVVYIYKLIIGLFYHQRNDLRACLTFVGKMSS